jgi:uncharacterized glyoxalase superfamily protein PhnB
MSNLENLKKQAKALVRLHREKSHHLSCVARETLPRFAALTDRQILAGEFRLADAQELVARQHGCQTWRELKARAEAAPAAPLSPAEEPDPPGLIMAVPMLYVADIRRALGFYVDRLGFEARQVSGEPPFYAEVGRGGAQLALRITHRPPIDPAVRASEPMLLQAAIRTGGDIKAYYLEVLAGGAEIDTPLFREPWGPQAFVVKDPDGNLVSFGERGPGAKARDG